MMKSRREMLQRFASITIVILFLNFIGCTKTITPQPHFLPDNAIPELRIDKTVSLVNSATSKEVTEFCSMAAGSHYEFTQTAINITEDALIKNGIKIGPDGDKILKMSLIAGCDSWSGIISASLKVETGSGITKEFLARRPVPSAYILSLAFERAIASVVKDMLNDGFLVGYFSH